MSGEELPSDLAAIERALRDGRQPDPALRQRVMAGVRDELRRSRHADFWRFAAGVAAAMLLAMNFTISATVVAEPRPRDRRQNAAALCEQLEQMQLGLSAKEVRREALLMAAGNDLIPMGRPRGSAGGSPMTLDR